MHRERERETRDETEIGTRDRRDRDERGEARERDERYLIIERETRERETKSRMASFVCFSLLIRVAASDSVFLKKSPGNGIFVNFK